MTSNKRPSPPPFIGDNKHYSCIFKERWNDEQRSHYAIILSEYFCSSKTIAQIIQTWKFDFHNSQFACQLPFMQLNLSCQKADCNGTLLIELISSEKKWNLSPAFCKICMHEIYLDTKMETFRNSAHCQCEDCINEKKIEIENKERKVKEREAEYINNLNQMPIEIMDLCHEEKFKLAIVLRASTDPNTSIIDPELCLERNNKLMKRNKNISDLFVELLKAGAIKVRTLNCHSDWDGGNYVIDEYYPLRCTYNLNVKNLIEINGQVLSQLEFELFQKIKDLEISEKRECILSLCKVAMLDELISYTESRCSDLNLPFTLPEKGKGNFEKILEMFDLARARNVIYAATRNVLEYEAKGLHKNKQHLSYLTPSFGVRYAERVRANGWKIEPYYDRNGVSVFSRTLADLITELGDSWESTSLNEISELIDIMS